MPRLLFACFVLGGLTPNPQPTDYCATSFCEPGLVNVACNPPPLTGGPDCWNPVAFEITSVEIDFILNYFNTLRVTYGSGTHLPTFPIASNMPTLQWDAELATQAGNNARTCVTGNDECRNTAQFPNSGQLQTSDFLYYGSSTSTNIFLNDLFKSIDGEKDVYTRGDALYSDYSSTTIGQNLAQVLNDRSSKVGCALQKWNLFSVFFELYFVVCNFSDNLIEGEPIYTQA